MRLNQINIYKEKRNILFNNIDNQLLKNLSFQMDNLTKITTNIFKTKENLYKKILNLIKILLFQFKILLYFLEKINFNLSKNFTKKEIHFGILN